MSTVNSQQPCSTSLATSYLAKTIARRNFPWQICALICASALCTPASAANLQLEVLDATGAALADVVVYAVPEHTGNVAKPTQVTQIEQVARKYQPLVTALQVGSQVSFPNNDTVRHHVYSFSAAKKFEMKLYSGVPSENVLFDKAGTVVLGCNIHDKMIAYIHVVDTPFFSKTDVNGKAQITNLPAGKYHLKAWHYAVPQNAGVTEQMLQVGAEGQSLQLKLATKATAGAPNSVPSGVGKY